MKDMLLNLGIMTTNIWITDGYKRKDGKINKNFIFGIRKASIGKFNKLIGFNKYSKQL